MATKRRPGEEPPPDDPPTMIDTIFGDDDDGLIAELEALDPSEIPQWISDNAGSFSEDDRATVDNWIRQQAGEAGLDGQAEWRPAVQAADSLYYLPPAEDVNPEDVESGQTPTVEGAIADQSIVATEAAEREQQEEYDAALEAYADKAAEIWGDATGPRPTFDHIADLAPEGLSATELEDFYARGQELGNERALEAARDVAEANGATPEEADAYARSQVPSMDLFGTSEPDWLLRLNGNMQLSEQQKDRYVQYWNDAHGTHYRDFDRDLAPALAGYDGTETEALNFANAVLADQEPMIAHAISLPMVDGPRRVTYTDAELEYLRGMGFSNDAIVRMVRVAGMSPNAVNAIRQGSAGETLDIGPMAALVRYYGGGSELGAQQQNQQNIAEIEQQLGLEPGDWARMTAKERQAFREQKDDEWRSTLPSGAPTSSFGEGPAGVIDRLEGLTRQGARREDYTTPGLIAVNRNFERGMDTYRGDQLLAFIHAIDPNLAQRVAATGGDAEKLDWRDNEAVQNMLEQGGYLEGSNVQLSQLASTTNLFGYFTTGGGRGGGAAEVRRMVDPESVRQQVQELWSRLFLADVDDATVQAVTANLQQQLDNAPDGMSFDVSSRIMAFLQGQDVYDELYRNKPAGLTEEQFQGQFAAGIADVIGNELDPEALKAGMRTGDYNTAVGRAASSEKLLTSSTLRGRWAQAKQTLDRFS